MDVLKTGRILSDRVYAIEIFRESDAQLLMTIMDDRVVVHSDSDISFRIALKDNQVYLTKRDFSEVPA